VFAKTIVRGITLAGLKRTLADGLGNVLGAYIIEKKGAPYWPERFFVQRMFHRLNPDCVFDIGANGGQYGQDLRGKGFAGTILSFEPNPAAFDRLKAAAASDPNWHCYPVALGEQPGVLPFNVMKDDVFSSFRKPSDEGGGDFSHENQIVDTIEVRVERLDAMLPELQSKHRFANPFLKMDTQGFDLEVFRGAGVKTSLFCGILSEVSSREIYADSPDIIDSLTMLRAAGFDLAAMHPVHAGMPIKAYEFNCYFVRRDLADADYLD